MADADHDLQGVPPVAVDRVRHQRESGVRGSLLSAPAAAAIRSADLEPVGEVFGCIVISLGWLPGGCGYAYGWNRGGGWGGLTGGWSGGVPGTVGGGIAGGTTRGGGSGGPGFRMAPPGWQGGGLGWGYVTPVVVSGDLTSSRFTWARPYAEAVQQAIRESHRRMLAEASALGADGVLGITRQTRSIDGSGHEYSSLGTAVRHVDPRWRREPGQAPWAATLTGEDCAAAAAAGFQPAGVAFGYSLALKHEDWPLRQQRSSFSNTEVDGLTELLNAARADARRSLAREARRLGGGGDVVVTDNTLRTFERPCTGEEKDLMAEAVFVGTVLVPHPAGPRRRGRTLTVLPLTSPSAPATRRVR